MMQLNSIYADMDQKEKKNGQGHAPITKLKNKLQRLELDLELDALGIISEEEENQRPEMPTLL